MHVGMRGWKLEESFTNLKNKISNNSKLFLWIIFFYILIMGIIIYCFFTDFTNVQEYVYNEF